MRAAEALALRADAQRRFEQLRGRAQASARYQEGEEPAEDANALVAEAEQVLVELEDLIRRINRTNAATSFDGGTVTDALAQRTCSSSATRSLVRSPTQHRARRPACPASCDPNYDS
jgi:hypothetical protein